eukprot:COSAG04_NODE_10265_length_791_cov_1.065029_3_plen_22_part_01
MTTFSEVRSSRYPPPTLETTDA